MIEAYCNLHELGIVKSVEVWQDGQIVGGLYGIDLGHIFVEKACFLKSLMQVKSLYQLSASFAKKITNSWTAKSTTNISKA
jgi:Leu/Phe-tRNA-protein transferase